MVRAPVSAQKGANFGSGGGHYNAIRIALTGQKGADRSGGRRQIRSALVMFTRALTGQPGGR